MRSNGLLSSVRWIPGAAAALLSLVWYVRTLTPGVQYHDFGEMQVHAWKLGIAHGTGYPLYIWLGHLFGLLVPLSTPAYRMNLFSAVTGALAVWLLHALLIKITSGRWWGQLGAMAAALLFGWSYTLWAISTFAQMYALHVLLVLLVTSFAIRWKQESRERWLWLALFTTGAMFGNHLCALSVPPALALFLFSIRPREWLGARRLGLAALSSIGGVVFGNLFLFWLLWRQHAPWDYYHASILSSPDQFPHATPSFWSCWWFNTTAQQYRWEVAPGLSWAITQGKALPHRLVGEFFPLGAALSLGGLVVQWRRDRRAALLFAGIFAAQSVLNLHYRVWKVPYYFGGPYACAAIWVGEALAFVGGAFARLAARWPAALSLPQRRSVAAVSFTAALALAQVVNLALGGPYLKLLQRVDPESADLVRSSFGNRPDLSKDHRAEEDAHQLLGRMPDGALVLADWGILFTLVYQSFAEGRRDMTFEEAYPAPAGFPFSKARQERLLGELQRRPVFMVGDPGGAAGAYDLKAVGHELYQLVPKNALKGSID